MGRLSILGHDFEAPKSRKTAVAVFCGIICSTLWVLVMCGLLAMSAIRYNGGSVDLTRARAASILTKRVGNEAAGVFMGALSARDAMDYAIQRKLYVDPMDVLRARIALEPVFAAVYPLLAVDLAFTLMNESLSFRRMPERVGGNASGAGLASIVLTQTDHRSCRNREVFSHNGCLVQRVPAPNQSWFQVGLGLDAGSENEYRGPRPSVQWLGGPGFVPNKRYSTITQRVKDADQVSWAPAYSLVFRSVFPGSAGRLSTIGRITVEIASLSTEEWLLDEVRLGVRGKIFICDRLGTLLAAPDPSLLAMIESPSGNVRFRFAWELKEEWAEVLIAADFADGQERQKYAGDFLLTIGPVRGRNMDHFSVLVVTERTPFVEAALTDIGWAGLWVVAPFPFLISLLVYICWRLWKEYRKRFDGLFGWG